MSIYKARPILILLISLALLNSCSHYTEYAPVTPGSQSDVNPPEPEQPKKTIFEQKPTEQPKAFAPPKPLRPITSDKRKPIGSGTKYYVVEPNDTLYSIGVRSGHGYESLARWNDLLPSYHVQAGQKLKLFNPLPNKQKDEINIAKVGSSSQKKPIISIANDKSLKLNWHWPIRGAIVKKYSQSGNKGIDIQGKIGQAVQAAEAGKVVYSGKGLLGYGSLLIIKHNDLYLSAYANNSQLRVTEGQKVERGQVIAEVGAAGAKHSALHFEIRENGKSVNPLNYLPEK